ncbi:non-ribosomal peptide synthetase [Streptomyces sp. NBC_01754]|uniref:non-ribosomal peptide synthetase n=1 Tax=Streptomyces sp. NBC_01754 TaxID=2975930 RepID=UPI002DDA6112|nr:non-ribosomal peptide synthetase [Streptomyces sp. NBC_01754]WSC91572.1 non-ribosomal peptide synthetase [Streptomyces sp. NBC_01754]
MTATTPHDPGPPPRPDGGPPVPFADRHRLGTGYRPLAGGETIPAAFAAQAARRPDAPAVLGEGEPWTYRVLADAADRTAAALRAAGIRHGDRVGILLDHSPQTVAAILGVLSAGGCYVPLDPGHPVPRLAQLVALAGIDLVVADGTGLANRLRDEPLRVVEPPDPAGTGGPDVRPAGQRARPDDLAYLLCTSGSTGRPKGVPQTHRNVLHGVANHIENFRLTPADRLSVVSSFGFDMAVTDTFAALLAGAAAVLVDVRRHGPAHLAEALADRGTTVLHCTPTVYRYLVDALGERRLDTVRAVVLGGETVTRHDALRCRAHFAPDCVFVNGYGATEASFAVQDHLPPDAELEHDVLPIGYPLAGYEVSLLGPGGEPAADEGEIVIRSPYVAPGYWQAPELTAERFGRDGTGRGVPSYRTGDLGRRLPDGRLAYLGRLDRQVKIRGIRVELGEVEYHLAALPGVLRAVAVARTDDTGRTELLGHVQPVAGTRLDPGELRRRLSAQVPEHLVPRLLTVLDALPLTSTGKVDTRALPDPRAPRPVGRGPEPSTATEEAIARAWATVLKAPAVVTDANFFDLGGDSLLMADVQRLLRDGLGVPVPLLEMYRHPTVAALARHLDGDAAPATAPATAPGLRRVTERAARRARREGKGRR